MSAWYAPVVGLFAKLFGRTAEYRSDPDRQHLPYYDGKLLPHMRRSTGLTWMPMSRMGEPVVMQAERWQSVYVIVDHDTYWTAQVRTGPKPLLWLGDIGQLHTMRDAMLICQAHADEVK